MTFHVGAVVTLEEILAAFGERIAEIGSDKLLLTGFIDFQYGQLSEDCNPHKPVLKRLEKLNLLKGYFKGFKTLQDKEQDKDKEKEKESINADFQKKQFLADILAESYRAYPRKEGKSTGFRKLKAEIKTAEDAKSFRDAVARYAEHCRAKQTDAQYIKHFSTFVTSWRDWLDPDTGSASGPTDDRYERLAAKFSGESA
jgi:hypothetical protein